MKKLVIVLLFVFIAASQARGAHLNNVAAVVNGKAITMYDLQKEAAPALFNAKVNPANPAQAARAREIMKGVLDSMILDILVAQEAKRLKISVPASQIDEEIAKRMRAMKMNKKQFEEAMARQRLTTAELRSNIEKNLLRQKVLGMEVGSRVIVTPEEIKNYYEAHKDEMIDRKGLHMGLIVYHPKAPAEATAAQLKSGKMSFREACSKYSITPKKNQGCDEGPVEWDRLNPEWEQRLTKMKPGNYTSLFNLQNFKAQVHLFRPDGNVEERKLTLQEATPMIDSILRNPKAKNRFMDYEKQLKDKAIIKINYK